MILALTYFPCKDASLKYNNVKVSVAEKGSDQKHADSDVCSPFCTCTCCTTPTVTQVQLRVINLPIHITVYRSQHLVGKFIDVSLPIWQPPQIA